MRGLPLLARSCVHQLPLPLGDWLMHAC